MKKIKLIGALFAALLLVPLLGGLFVFTPKVSAATITVTTTADEDSDPGPGTGCSFAEAIRAANNDAAYGGCLAGSGDDTINVPAGTYNLTTNPPAAINSGLTILGDPAGGTILNGAVLYITTTDADQVVLVRDVTIRNSADNGVSITGQNEGYSINFDRVTIEDNAQAGISHTRYQSVSTGNVHITNSLIRNNNDVGLLNNECQGVGTMYVTNTMVSGNGRGGIAATCGHLVLDRVTVSNNTSPDSGAGIQGFGQFDLTNVTVSNNTSQGSTGGVEFGNSSIATLTNVTIANNTGLDFGGVSSSGATLTFRNTLIANNTGPECVSGIDDFVIDYANNMSTDITCTENNEGVFVVVDDAKLAASPSDNGGEAPVGSGGLGGNVLTMALLEASPAIDGGDNNYCPVIDERNAGRPFGGACDIGAYEAQYASVAANSTAQPTVLADTGQNTYLISASGLLLLVIGSLMGRHTLRKSRQI